MALKDDLSKEVAEIFRAQWSARDGTVVPDETKLTLGNDGVNLDATILYADLSESTKLVDNYQKQFAAEIYKAYLRCAAKIIRAEGGTITSYDGDRIMAVFIGKVKNTAAARTGLKINWACQNIIQPAIQQQYPKTKFQIKQTVGIDTSKLLVARAGIRGANDLVWIGRAANWAAKLTTLSHDYPTRITKAVYEAMMDSSKISSGKNMWESVSWTANNNAPIYRSRWTWVV